MRSFCPDEPNKPADFLPAHGSIQFNGTYRPVFRLFASENWRMVKRDRKPILCATASEAVAIAKAHLIKVLNPPIRSHAAEPEAQQQINKIRASDLVEPSEPQDPLGTSAWIAGRAERQQAEISRAFGANKLFIKGRTVQVEHRRKRA